MQFVNAGEKTSICAPAIEATGAANYIFFFTDWS